MVDQLKIVSPVSQRLVEVVNVNWEATAEPWETFELSDGTTVKMRVTPNSIQRLEGEFDNAGNPVYIFNNSVSIRVVKARIRGEPTQAAAPAQKAGRDPAVG